MDYRCALTQAALSPTAEQRAEAIGMTENDKANAITPPNRIMEAEFPGVVRYTPLAGVLIAPDN